MTRLYKIITDIKKLEDELEKSWKKAQIGEIRTRQDGKKYKKVADTGNTNKDWQLVTQPKDKQDGSGKSPKQRGNEASEGKEKLSNKELNEAAKNASETALNNAIKQSGDPLVRETAHKELKRREEEEKPQEESKEKPAQTEEKEDKDVKSQQKEPETKEEIESEIKRLRSIDTDDLDEIVEISDKVQDLLKKRKEVLENVSSERKVSFEEYRKGFKDLSKKSSKDVSDFYLKETEKINEYLKGEEYAETALDFYLSASDGYEKIRDYLSNDKKDLELEEYSNNISIFIKNNKITENLSLNRRVKGEGVKFFQSLNKGDVYEDKSFSSTSLQELEYFGEFNIEILAKRGSKVANVGNVSEYEYVVDKGSKFRVLDKTDNGIIVELL